MPSPTPDPTPVPTVAASFDVGAWAGTLDAAVTDGLDLMRLLVFAVVLVGGILVSLAVARVVMGVGGSGG